MIFEQSVFFFHLLLVPLFQEWWRQLNDFSNSWCTRTKSIEVNIFNKTIWKDGKKYMHIHCSIQKYKSATITKKIHLFQLRASACTCSLARLWIHQSMTIRLNVLFNIFLFQELPFAQIKQINKTSKPWQNRIEKCFL